MHISSLIVDVAPDRQPHVDAALSAWPGVQIHTRTPEGRRIVLLETDTEAEASDSFRGLSAIDGVMSVSLVYHQFISDPDEEVCDGIDAT